ncbi:MAG TPA: TIGR04076 family protein [Candidatus Bathyarchaeia archaeon]|nr:TIGR04076 family protein [Candidatus Bathyarchaeia archaeon]
MARHRVKITVLKRVEPSYIFDGKVPISPGGKEYSICTAFEDGQEFIVDKNVRCPEGFCSYAWKDIFSDLRVLALGGDHEPWVEKPKMISCCTDGIRPVSFVLERLDD